MRTILAIFDRTAVLALGLGAGILIGLSFHPDGGEGGSAVEREAALPPPGAPAGTPAAIAPAGPVQPKGKPTAVAPVDAPELKHPVAPEAVAHAAADGTIRVGVFGDSFGDGVWAALYHQLPAKQRFRVYKFSQQATGFTRYRSLNLEDRAREQIAAQPIDVAVISFGANDTQGVWDGDHAYALMTPGWQRVIGERATRFVQQLRQSGAQVYWVGLPVMRKPSFDQDISAMNAFYARLMAGLGVPWIETRSLTVGADGGYAPYLPDPETGAPRLMRANDGIHMSMNGYEHLTGGLAGRIRRYADMVRTRAGVHVDAAAPPSPTVPVAPPPAKAVAKPAEPAPTKPKPPRDQDLPRPAPAPSASDATPEPTLSPAPAKPTPAPKSILPDSFAPPSAASDPQRQKLTLPDLEDHHAAPTDDAKPKKRRRKDKDEADTPAAATQP